MKYSINIDFCLEKIFLENISFYWIIVNFQLLKKIEVFNG